MATAVASGNGAAGSSGTSGSQPARIYLGSCVGQDGSCTSDWDIPTEGMNMPAMFESVCTTDGGTYSASVVCSGGVPGCCTLAPNVSGPKLKVCYKVTDGDPDGALKRQCIEGFEGTWE